jgi:hypothetical protein
VSHSDDVAPKESLSNQPGNPTASLALGCFGLIAWICPIIGVPVTATGLVLGLKALNREENRIAVFGVTLSSIGLALSLVSSVASAYLIATGRV